MIEFPNDIMLTAAPAEIVEASAEPETRPATVRMMAYAGGLIRVAPHGPLVIDLAGLEVPEQVPLLAAHQNTLGGVAGQGAATVTGGKLMLEGSIARNTEAGDQVLNLHHAGVALRASVGVELIESRRIRAGETININNQTITAPAGGMLLVTNGRLREVSFVPAGADPQAQVQIAASSGTGVVAMTEAEIRADERNRIARIEATCTGLVGSEVEDLKAQAITGEISEGELAQQLLPIARRSSERPRKPFASQVQRTGNANPDPASHDVLAAAVMIHAGCGEYAEAAYQPDVLNRASDLRARSLVDIAQHALSREGREIPRTVDGIINASYSSIAMPTALTLAGQKIVEQAYAATPATWEPFSKQVDLADFRPGYGVRPSFLGGLQELPPGGNVHHGQLGEATSTIQLGTFAELYRVSRRDFINDDGGVFSQMIPALAQAAKRTMSDVVYSAILSGEAAGHFHADNGNLETGGGSVMGAAGLEAAIQAMRDQVDSDSNNLDIIPKFLLAPSALDSDARTLLNSLTMSRDSTAGDQAPEGNPFARRLDLLIEPRLGNTAKFTTASATAWYVVSAKAHAPMYVGTLNGQKAPIIESFGPDHQADTLAFTWRVYLDFGAALGDPRAMVKSLGS